MSAYGLYVSLNLTLQRSPGVDPWDCGVIYTVLSSLVLSTFPILVGLFHDFHDDHANRIRRWMDIENGGHDDS
ncbi:hypothetical protein BU25DRAFT_38010 [Macroventuria anomochaeta]|uniref:Uncharacterized protein n=1 Tax=Macroventuria anomochaeta TaxID=301207 RepID=A0ACB6S2P7_9PLEO|nr:uncharacterized protein BU25DRAFT_38010 [Macroventuria anomochaeta]KAF2628551.1 hypothetical protein BU25DRAFT_38010 [Macroventuria anomochaeta]